MNILLLASHGIAEYDDIRMFHRAGFDVFCPGGYADPANPAETLRPALPEVPYHPGLAAACEDQRARHAGEDAEYVIDWAKADVHPDVLDWADVAIVHHFPERWIPQLLGKTRVIWRTCGQSDPRLERFMGRLEGLEIVRYSPRERIAFGADFAGEDALIRFGKFPDDYGPWTGDDVVIGNVTQNMVARGDACGLSYYLAATEGLPATPAGPGSQLLPGGIGPLSYDGMREYLRRCRAYLYTGTSPAPYTLGLIEAMLSGVPVVSANPSQVLHGPLFEGHEIVGTYAGASGGWGVETTRRLLRDVLNDADAARWHSEDVRKRAVALFDVATVGQQWTAYLGARVAEAVA